MGGIQVLQICLRVRQEPVLDGPCQCGPYDPELNCLTTLLNDVCEALEASGAVDFGVEGFEIGWPTTVGYSLPLFLEKLPALMVWAHGEGPDTHRHGFNEQGVERTLVLAREGTQIRIVCNRWRAGSRHEDEQGRQYYPIKYEPVGHEELISTEEMARMLAEVRSTFLDLVQRVCPGVYEHEWLQQWIRETEAPVQS